MYSSKVRDKTDLLSLISDLRVLNQFFEENKELRERCVNKEGYLRDTKELRYLSRTADVLAIRIDHGLHDNLITQRGQLNNHNVAALQSRGFHVVVVDSDSFGPLAAAVVAGEFKVSFG